MVKQPFFRFLCALLLLLAFNGCYNEEFRADVFDPRLPEYSESGQNHAGAYVNDQPWRSFPRFVLSPDPEFASFLYDSTSAHYRFFFPQGNIITTSGALGERINLRFIISAHSLLPLIDGTAVYPLIIALGGAEDYAEIERDVRLGQVDPTETCHSNNGFLYIRFATIIGEDKVDHIHLAGTFGFDVDDECGKYDVRSGRFDFFFQCFEGKC